MSGASARRPTGSHPGARRTSASASSLASSPVADAPAAGTKSAVRWSGTTTRSTSASATAVIASSGRPRRCTTVTSVCASSRSRSASLTSDRTSGVSHCANSIGTPRSSCSGSSARASSTRAPVDIGSTPRRDHAASANDRPGTTSSAIVTAGGRVAQEIDRSLGDRGVARHRVRHRAVLACRGEQRRDDRPVAGVEVARRLVVRVERVQLDAVGGQLGDRRMASSAHVAHRARLERGACCGHEQVGAGGSEPDDDDPARLARHVSRLLRLRRAWAAMAGGTTWPFARPRCRTGR